MSLVLAGVHVKDWMLAWILARIPVRLAGVSWSCMALPWEPVKRDSQFVRSMLKLSQLAEQGRSCGQV